MAIPLQPRVNPHDPPVTLSDAESQAFSSIAAWVGDRGSASRTRDAWAAFGDRIVAHLAVFGMTLHPGPYPIDWGRLR